MFSSVRMRRFAVVIAVAAAVVGAGGIGPAQARPPECMDGICSEDPVDVPDGNVRIGTVPEWVAPEGFEYRIFSFPVGNRVRCLDADNRFNENGMLVQLWDCLGTDPSHNNQIWTFEKTNVKGLYRIRSKFNGRCLDADLGSINGNATWVQLWDCLGLNQKNQFWWLTSGSHRLVSNFSGRVLDADLGTAHHNGTIIQLWDNLGRNQHNQVWFFDDIAF
jgi:hypothetical protein